MEFLGFPFNSWLTEAPQSSSRIHSWSGGDSCSVLHFGISTLGASINPGPWIGSTQGTSPEPEREHSNIFSPFPHGAPASTSSILGSLKPFLAAKGKGGREREIPGGWSGIPDTMGTFLSNFPLCCKWQRSRIYLHVSGCPGELTFPLSG